MAKKDKNLQKVTATLAELSRGANGQIDAVRVKAVLAELPKAFPPAQLRPILEAFYAAVGICFHFDSGGVAASGIDRNRFRKTLLQYDTSAGIHFAAL